MSNVFENVIAGIIVAGLLTVAGLLLTFGIKFYYKSKANLTIWLLEKALKSNTKDPILEKRIVDIVRHESSIIGSEIVTLVIEHLN